MGSVYKIVEIVGTSEKSWEDAARVALKTASKSIEEIRIAEVNKLNIKVEKDARLTLGQNWIFHCPLDNLCII